MTDVFAGLDEVRWGEMDHAYGPAVEIPDLLQAELAAVRRHNARPDTIHSAQVTDDEELLRLCRSALLG
jgi:hypothetical protein